jgi:uncharacterized Zn-binding protein involved in type VI secretion
MPGIARDAGVDSAGGPIIEGSPNVFANESPVARVGDAVAGHGRGSHTRPVMAEGSSNVFTNGIPTCRAGDPASCGDVATGSSDVFAN